ncbi:16S rRNA (guanine(966)-N(2))-methyltransferase RsmD [Moheibacter sp.]|uniref:16S rRNA (guanine(966)-N(2))-methyltransferase RsmD n=1 Tax=Moheibacter sp. TaxID=1965316 RepID=UPI003C71F49F
MRIISGSFRGKKINAPANLPVRPTTDFAKEALFNVLNNHYDLDEISVLDLFSGIGSISLEFASRGSQRVLSVDQDAGCVKFLSETVKSMNLEEVVSVLRNDVFQFLKRNTQGSFDVIFADPPFHFEQEEYDKIIEFVRDNDWLKPEGELVLEHSSNIKFEDHPNLIQTRKYGNVNFSFFEFS